MSRRLRLRRGAISRGSIALWRARAQGLVWRSWNAHAPPAWPRLLIAALAAPSAGAAQTSLADVEDEVMCVQCKTPLDQSHAPAAERERAFIRRGIAAGQSKAADQGRLVAQFGPAVLAEPQDSGFGRRAARADRGRRSPRSWRCCSRRGAGAPPGPPVRVSRRLRSKTPTPWRLDRELSAFDKRT